MQLEDVWEISSSSITFCGVSCFLKLCMTSGCRMLVCMRRPPLFVFYLGGLEGVMVLVTIFSDCCLGILGGSKETGLNGCRPPFGLFISSSLS